jgi:hypothetical protein
VRHEPYSLTTTYTYVRSRERDDSAWQEATLTPRHSAGVVGMWERENVGRVGVEFYYTGVQRLEENPYRSTSKPYVVLGLLGERQVGRLRVIYQRREPHQRPTDAVGSAGATHTRRGRTMDSGRVGAVGGNRYQRRNQAAFLTTWSDAPPSFLRGRPAFGMRHQHCLSNRWRSMSARSCVNRDRWRPISPHV